MSETACLKSIWGLPLLVQATGCSVSWLPIESAWWRLPGMGWFVFASYKILPGFSVPYLCFAIGALAYLWNRTRAEHARLLRRAPLLLVPAAFLHHAMIEVGRFGERDAVIVAMHSASSALISSVLGYAGVYFALAVRAFRNWRAAIIAP